MSDKKCSFKCMTYQDTMATIGDDEESAKFERFAVVEVGQATKEPIGADDINWNPNREQRILAGAVMRDMLEHCTGPVGSNCGTYPETPLGEGLPDVVVALLVEGWVPPEQ